MRVRADLVARATGSCRCAHHAAPTTLRHRLYPTHASPALRASLLRLTVCGGSVQALQEAGYLAQMQDQAASGGLAGMSTGLGVTMGEMAPPGMPMGGDLSGIANLSNPDAGPK